MQSLFDWLLEILMRLSVAVQLVKLEALEPEICTTGFTVVPHPSYKNTPPQDLVPKIKMYRFVDILAIISMVQAMPDVRLDPRQRGAPQGIEFREPDTFGYQALVNQRRNNRDNFLRSNIDNQANQRNAAKEPARDMLPCRQEQRGPAMQFARGQPQQIPLRWNNPHDSDCEVNIFTDGLTQVAPIRLPAPCGGGYQDQRFSFTVPTDFPAGKCESAAENCVLQIYGHSVEPRTYAICIDFTLTPAPGAPAPGVPAPAPGNGTLPAPTGNGTAPVGNLVDYSRLTKRQAPNTKDIPNTRFQKAIHYHDSFDTSHVDSAYSGYRGQQGAFIRDELKAAIQLQSFTPNGGLVPLGDIDKRATQKMRDQVQKAVKAAEKLAIQRNRAAQAKLTEAARRAKTPRQCFEGELYGVVNNPNCNRQFTNTYVTNVGYRQIFNQFLPKFLAANMTQYAPKLKTEIGGTPADPFGQFRVNGRPSMVPQGRSQRGAPQPLAAPKRVQGPEPEQISNLSSRVNSAPVAPLPPNLEVAAQRVNETVPMNPDDRQLPDEAKTPAQRIEEQRTPPPPEAPQAPAPQAPAPQAPVPQAPAPQAPAPQAPAPQAPAPQAPVPAPAPAPKSFEPVPGNRSNIGSMLAQLRALVSQMNTVLSSA
jgi:hypothetical protein